MKLRNNKIYTSNMNNNTVGKKKVKTTVVNKTDVKKNMNTARIQVSNLFVIMGMNYFKKFDKVLSDIWKTYDKTDYQRWVKKIEDDGFIPATISAKKQLELFEKKHNSLNKLNISNVLDKASSMNNAEDMTKAQTSLIQQMKLTLPQSNDSKKDLEHKKDIERLEKLMTSMSNTKYGIKQEDNVIAHFSKIIEKPIKSTQKMFNHQLGDLYGIKWSLVGKVDGITSDLEVVEIKNRVKGLFGELRSYEKPQIMTYLRLSGSEKGYMVECFRKKDKTIDLGILNVEYEEGYFECDVIPAIDKFTRFFKDFINNDEWKSLAIKGNESKLYDIFQSY